MAFKVLKAVIFLTFAVILVSCFCSSSFLIQKPTNHSKRVATDYYPLRLNDSTSLRAPKGSFIEDSNSFMRRMEERMSRRRLHVQKICKAKGYSDEVSLIRNRVTYLEKFKVLFCQNPKTGITNMKKLFNKLANYEQDLKVPLEKLYQFDRPKVFNLLSKPDVLKLTVVREPFERILSAYRARIYVAEPWKKPFINYIHRSFGTNSSGPTTFSDFVSYLVNEDPSEPEIKGNLEKINFNYHWKKYRELCQPCAIDYDVIAHLETIEEDSRYFLQLIGAPPNITLAGAYKSTPNLGKIKSYFTSVLPRENLERLYGKFEDDYLLFNYSRPTDFF
ncbi:unnamed protein product [Clavelina lepadiformis]|uniref:Carbohydrate sulfotransferase n=1 Tax=Clavelina lepadiformis TaxID=159417 RepID=A0ABP0GID1_CLALP